MKDNKVKIFFRTRNYCTVNAPNFKNKKDVIEWIIDQISAGENEEFEWIDFEIEDFEIIE